MKTIYFTTALKVFYGTLMVSLLGCAINSQAQPARQMESSKEQPTQILPVLAEIINGSGKHNMMKQYLLAQADKKIVQWKADYEKRKTNEEIEAYQNRLREKFIQAIGGLPERTPLNPQITSIVPREGYQVEKVIFESQPGLFVTAALFLPKPDRFTPPYPGVIIPCGHYKDGKACETYQTMGAALSLCGIAALVFDPIDQGERMQTPDEEGGTKYWGTSGHMLTGVGSILLGRNTARFEIWDGMRAIDYLQTRPEVDPQRIGVTGNSGGGTQTSYLMALDERIRAAAPSCYLTGYEKILYTIGPQDAEQNIAGQLAWGMDHADYLMMRAPLPILICAATKDFFDIEGTWNCFRYAKRLYSRMGYPERIDLVENDAEHNYGKIQREGVARWMARWLRGEDKEFFEPEIKLLTEEEIQCTSTGNIMDLEGNRTVYELNQDFEKELASQREKMWAETDHNELLSQIRSIAGIRRLDEIPDPNIDQVGIIENTGYSVEKLILRPEEGIYLPALKYIPDKKTGSIFLYIHEAGNKTAEDAAVRMTLDGNIVFTVELRGTGETKQTSQGHFPQLVDTDWQDVYTAYLLGRSYVGMRAEDILITARYISQNENTEIHLIVVGNIAVPALHAAALERDLFASVKLEKMIPSWLCVIDTPITKNQLINTIHGALKLYDLPNLTALLGDKLTITDPLDAMGNPSIK